MPPDYRPPAQRHTVVVLVERRRRRACSTRSPTRSSIAPDHLVAVTVVADGDDAERIEKEWSEHGHRRAARDRAARRPATSPRATLRFIDELEHRWPNTIVTVLIPELFVEHWWEHLLHNQSALVLKGRLLFRKNTVGHVDPVPLRRSDR